MENKSTRGTEKGPESGKAASDDSLAVRTAWKKEPARRKHAVCVVRRVREAGGRRAAANGPGDEVSGDRTHSTSTDQPARARIASRLWTGEEKERAEQSGARTSSNAEKEKRAKAKKHMEKKSKIGGVHCEG